MTNPRRWTMARVSLGLLTASVLGMNDIGGGAAAAQLTAAMQQIIDRVHAKGLRIIGGTLFPVVRPDKGGWTSTMESHRLAVNHWIRMQANFDAVIDFDRLMSGVAYL